MLHTRPAVLLTAVELLGGLAAETRPVDAQLTARRDDHGARRRARSAAWTGGRRRIVWSIVVAGLEHAIDLAQLAMGETGMGVFEGQVLRNFIATKLLACSPPLTVRFTGAHGLPVAAHPG